MIAPHPTSSELKRSPLRPHAFPLHPELACSAPPKRKTSPHEPRQVNGRSHQATGSRRLMRTLILDADDSYSHNIVYLINSLYKHGQPQVVGSTRSERVEEKVIVIRVGDISWDKLLELIPHFGAIILGPGPGRPAHCGTHPGTTFRRLLREHPFDPPVPTFGLCLGHQALGAAFGGRIVPSPEVLHGVPCRVSPVTGQDGLGKGIFRGLEDGFEAVRYNSLTVEDLAAADVEVTARAGQGGSEVVMGLRHRSLPFESVQFHPESICSTFGDVILSNFFRLASQTSHVLNHPEAYSPLPTSIQATSRILPLREAPANPEPLFELRTAALGSHAPESRSLLAPQRVFEAFVRQKSPLGDVWLDSASAPREPGCEARGRYSFLASPDRVWSYFVSSKRMYMSAAGAAAELVDLGARREGGSFWRWAKDAQGTLGRLTRKGRVIESVDRTSKKTVESEPNGARSFANAKGCLPRETRRSLNADSPSSPHRPCSAARRNTNGASNHANGHRLADGPDPTGKVASPNRSSIPPGPVGFLGYIGYELLSESLVGHRLPPRGLPENAGVPDAELAFANSVLTYDHVEGRWWVTGLVRIGRRCKEGEAEVERCLGCRVGLDAGDWSALVDRLTAGFTEIEKGTRDARAAPNGCPVDCTRGGTSVLAKPLAFKAVVTEAAYKASVAESQRLIRAGESYEICMTTQFHADIRRGHEPYPRETPLDAAGVPPSKRIKIEAPTQDPTYPLYLALKARNPAPYGAYIRFSPYPVSVLSSSPERFLRVDASGMCEMKPIKGTARRNLQDPAADAAIATGLRADVKERAENLMITDLVRHDLASFCEVGSVAVPKLIEVETVATVHMLVSTVTGRLKPGVTAAEALEMTFPPGSMTGAPKLRSVELLDRLEEGRPRGIYSGGLGYLAVDGTADFSVVIRTAVVRGEEITLGGGGAITVLSDPEQEWAEVETKVQAVSAALNSA